MVRSCYAELKYGKILAVRGKGSELWLLKAKLITVQKKTESPVFLVLQLVIVMHGSGEQYGYRESRISDDGHVCIGSCSEISEVATCKAD